MDRYAVINKDGRVVNVIAWDGKTNWKPPEGHRVEANEEVGIGDVWHEGLQEFVRPMSMQKPPEDETSIAERKAIYEAAKLSLKSSMLIMDESGKLEAL